MGLRGVRGRGEMVSRKIMEATFGVLSGYWRRNLSLGRGDILGMGWDCGNGVWK